MRVLQKDVQVSGANHAFDIDIPQGDLTMDITLDGAALPATGVDSDSHLLYAVAKDTGVRHRIAFWYWSSNQLWMKKAERLIPGTYDILYRKGETTTDSGYVYRTEADDIGPNGVRVLQTNMIIDGANHLNIDIPQGYLTLDITLDGAALPATGVDSDSHLLYAGG